MGQHLKRHILESAGGAVPQLQAVGVVIQRPHRGHRGGVELLRAVGGAGIVRQLLDGKLLQKVLHNVDGPLLVGHALQILQSAARQLGDIAGRQQSAVRRKPLGNGLGGGKTGGCISCAGILHRKIIPICVKLKLPWAAYALILYYASFPREGQVIPPKNPS